MKFEKLEFLFGIKDPQLVRRGGEIQKLTNHKIRGSFFFINPLQGERGCEFSMVSFR